MISESSVVLCVCVVVFGRVVVCSSGTTTLSEVMVMHALFLG